MLRNVCVCVHAHMLLVSQGVQTEGRGNDTPPPSGTVGGTMPLGGSGTDRSWMLLGSE